MNKEQAIERLKEQQINDDTENAHEEADIILCAFLASLGYTDVVKEYEQVNKWYA